jgi:hypothetical protein
MKMAVESMEMAPGAILRLDRVLEQRILFDGGSAVELFVDGGFRP